jgi:hypothetical protein
VTRRWTRLITVTIVGVALGAMSAPALAGDLDEYLEKAADADYAGRRVVVTTWDGRTEAEVVEVEHAAGMMMIAGVGTDVVIGDGKVAKDGAAGVTLSGWSVGRATDKYSTGEVTELTRLGRPARSITVYEGAVVRARIIFDAATWAPLATEIYDGDGALFRFAAFTDFDATPRRVFTAMREHEGDAYDVVPQAASSPLPAEAGGYGQLDAYVGSDGVIQSFYGDGLFSFSVFVLPSGMDQPEMPEAEDMVVGGRHYTVVVEPNDVWVGWQRGTADYVLVGDLPPDHLELVLDALPAPKAPSLLERVFSLFG